MDPKPGSSEANAYMTREETQLTEALIEALQAQIRSLGKQLADLQEQARPSRSVD
ncbi:hypothetical protein [Belnapia rosea]|uniref:hypothetical protein n=1 Tax=Belnapia rosea TaxID=938405 RepID=UPI0015A4DF2B|nr:hypothetical protein [Belnapia rosea]